MREALRRRRDRHHPSRRMRQPQFHIIFVSVNAIALGRRARTRDAIGAVRHVFLDADHDGLAVLSRVEAGRDLPIPSYVLHSSPNHIHVFCRRGKGLSRVPEGALC
jgi:hypothetical protein